MTEFFAIDDSQLASLRALARRLHTEQRLTADEMRDAGHTLVQIADVCAQLEVDGSGVVKSTEAKQPEAES